jgi:hypothetical protein
MLKELLLDAIIFPIIFITRFPYLFLASFLVIQALALKSREGLYIHIIGMALGGLISIFGVPQLEEF